MARYTSGTTKAFFYIAVMLPMWASYIVKAYAWTVMLAKGGVLYWFVEHWACTCCWFMDCVLGVPGVGGNTLSTSHLGRFLVFTYIWLPFMILPIQAALERVPPNLLQASADLGARRGQTFRHVIWPLAFPGVVAGSIFTFSLTLGDFIMPTADRPVRALHRQHGLRAAGRHRQYADGGRVHGGAHRADRHLSDAGQATGGLRCTLTRAAARGRASSWLPGAGCSSCISRSW